MKVSTENDNNFGYEKITILVDNMPLIEKENMLQNKGGFCSREMWALYET